jgi:hypothetical protein
MLLLKDDVGCCPSTDPIWARNERRGLAIEFTLFFLCKYSKLEEKGAS